MSRLTALFICAIVIALTLSIRAQSPSPAQVVQVQTDLVNLQVLARQKQTGRLISDLVKDDFVVYEDGVEQAVAHFSRERLPSSVILLVDRAGCINAFDDQIREATVKALGRLAPEDEVAIMTFSNRVSLVQPFTRNRQLIADQVMAIEPQHHSEQHYFNAGIYEAATYMTQAAQPAGRRSIIVLTSLEASIDFSKRTEKEALEALLESGAIVSGVLVKTVGGRIEQTLRGKPTSVLRRIGLRAGSLKMFVAETGGDLLSEQPSKMEGAIATLVDRLAASYSLAYQPTNQARDGRRRRVRVELKPEAARRAGPNVLVTRRSYIIPRQTTAASAPAPTK